ncbi:hypothetical protein A9P82_05865 [Arachidicoccus ginsenosidimutans]|uniref:helix-turn-helix domain-containing protein n=1 Tax=Arachidicoccus sp. BS20 TaxID=1850526 RepID=UPI0007F0F157|nr:helix-turn-helix transcriptional regulator [Arachidicoccus sp. BS20]ANI88857.1 hypothetical protein A9P82_05865 [Arachidicoccus sp. BS20]
MAVIIGEKIKQFAEDKGLTQKQFGALINRHEKTVANIYKRKTIDTELLLSICKATNHDFFNYYYQIEPLKTFRKNELAELKKEIEVLKNQLAQKENQVSAQAENIRNQNDAIRLLKEKEKFLSNKKK